MPRKSNKVDKASLEEYKDKLIKEIYYYDKKIEEARNNLANNPRTYEVSSDSDSDLSSVLDRGPSLLQLKTQEAMLKTCLQATQELTNLEVLESEVNVLVQAPTFEGESPITKPGTWQEVMADCCVDLVPFNITFYAHRGEGKFAPVSYRGLRVVPLKSSHEVELVKSILPDLRRPSDAVEMIRSYAVAHRSRRSTLARLADKFGSALFMEPKESGGYLLKCANLFEVSWTLQNKWSPIAPFHHRLTFELEYMHESYIKTIKQVHRQLCDPAVDTDERTLLLARIISTCLAARPLESDTCDLEAADVTSPHKQGEKRRTTLDKEPELPNMKRKKDSEVMAPPKTVPKKVKSKVKSPIENKIADPKGSKRPLQDNKTNDDVNKPKLNEQIQDNPRNEVNNETEASAANSKAPANSKNNARSVSGKSKKEKSVVNSKSEKDKINIDADEINETNEDIASNIQNQANTQKAGKKTANTENKTEMQVKCTKTSTVTRKSTSNVKTDSEKQANPKALRNSAPPKKIIDRNNVKNTKTVKSAGSAKKSETIEKQVSQKDGNVIKIVKNITNEKGEVVKKVVKKLSSDKPKVTEKVSVPSEQKPASKLKTNLPKKTTVINKVLSSESVKKTTNSTNQVKKPLNEQNNKISKTANEGALKKDTKNPTEVPDSGNMKKTVTSSGIEKENTAQNKIVSSKIPQKKIAFPKKIVKKMPIRISPRKTITKSKPPLAGANLEKIVQKSVTGIPRLQTKPRPKVV